MKLTRRKFLLTGSTATATGLAGCLDAIGDGEAEFEASPATVGDDALDEAGYEERRVRDVEMTRTFETDGESQEVTVTNVVAEYDRPVEALDDTRGAVFAVLSTPQVQVLGQQFNPVGEMDSEELVEMVQDRYEGVGNVESEEEYTETVLGTDTRVVRYDAEGDHAEAGTVDATLHVSDPVESGDDFVVAAAAYPDEVDEEGRARTLLRGIEHPT